MNVEVEAEGDAGPTFLKRATTETERARLRTEATTLAAARHPGVVDLLSFVDAADPARTELRLGWVGPHSLATATVSNPQEAATLVAALADTVSDLHGRGLVHTRISADHVVLAADGRPVLCGLAEAGSVNRCTPSEDVAALGTLLTELLAGGADGQPELEPIPDRRGLRHRPRWTGYQRRALLLLADQAQTDEVGARPSAREFAEAIRATVPVTETPVRARSDRRMLPGAARGGRPSPRSGRKGSPGPALLPPTATLSTPPASVVAPAQVEARRAVKGSVGGAPDGDDQWPASTPRPIAPSWPRPRAGRSSRTATDPVGWLRPQSPPSGLPPLQAGYRQPTIRVEGAVQGGSGRPVAPDRPSGSGAGSAGSTPRPPVPTIARRPSANHRARVRSALPSVVASLAVAIVLGGSYLLLGPARGHHPAGVSPAAAALTPAQNPSVATVPETTPSAVTQPVIQCRGIPTGERSTQCPASAVNDGRIVVAGTGYQLGRPGDLISIADWFCDGRPTPALLRRATGDVFVFRSWATTAHPVTVTPVATIPGAEQLRAALDAATRCARLVIDRSGGPPVTIDPQQPR